MQKKPELLAPAGDMERLKMAVLYGADAVYLAGTSFGMRSFAGNFSDEELPAAVLERVDTTTIGHYDDNSRPKQYKRRYDEIFLYNVTLLRKK